MSKYNTLELNSIEVEGLLDDYNNSNPSTSKNIIYIQNKYEENNCCFGCLMGSIFGLFGLCCLFCVTNKTSYLKGWLMPFIICTIIVISIVFVIVYLIIHNRV